MYQRLYKIMLVCSICLSAASMSLMLYFSATKTIVIAQEPSAENADYRQMEEGLQEYALSFLAGDGTYMKIPLPSEIRADDLVIENRYMEHSLYIILDGKYGEFYRENALTGDGGVAESGFVSEENGMTRLRLQLDGLYEHEYMFENGMLELSFAKPGALYDRIVVLDAAHGGSDSGYSGYGLMEKEITLEITEKVRELLDGSDIRVYCTRTDDTGLTDEERAGFVDELGADLLISVRTGADENNSRVFGIQTFYNDTYFIPYFGNVELADLLERNVVTAVNGKANGMFAAEADDMLLRTAQIPAAAIEAGYLTNGEEAALLASEEYRDRLAEGVADAIRAAFAAIEQKPESVTG